MSARHAGFAAVTRIDGDLVNDLIEAAFANYVAPLTFVVPTVQVGSYTVKLAGTFTVLPPQVSFARRPDNLVTVRARFSAELSLDAFTSVFIPGTPSPILLGEDVVLEIGCNLLVGLKVSIVTDRFQVGLDLSQASVTQIDVNVLEGFPLRGIYAAALRSGPVLAALTAALHAIPPSLLFTTINGFAATIRIAPRQMPCGASLFELPTMFDASFSISRVVPVILDGSLAIGVDIAGQTLGDPNGLAAPLAISPRVWVTTSNIDGPVRFEPHFFPSFGNLWTSINPDALVGLLEDILSPATFHAFVDCHVALENMSVSFGTIVPNLTTDHIQGATLHIGVRYYSNTLRDSQSRLIPGGDGMFAAVSIPFSFLFQTYEGQTDFVSQHRDYWYVKVFDVDIDLPWWVSYGILLLGIVLPIFTYALAALAEITSLLENIEGQVQSNAQAGINPAISSFATGPVHRDITLPFLPKSVVSVDTKLLAIGPEGVDASFAYFIGTAQNNSPDRLMTVTADGVRMQDRSGLVQDVLSAATPIKCVARLISGIVDPFDPAVRIRWQVTRSDTGDEIINQDFPLHAFSEKLGVGIEFDPGTIIINRADPALMVSDGFNVYVRIYRPLRGRIKEFGSCSFTIGVMDYLDRHHPFVRWTRQAYGRGYSAIHRTAIPGRCKMVQRLPFKTMKGFRYFDSLPFPASQLESHRKQNTHHKPGVVPILRFDVGEPWLCDYCFFGGPDKNKLLT